MPTNDSSTGGYLTPSSIGNDLNDAGLMAFLQPLVVGITGLPGYMVRPRWQPEPPNIPDFGTNWAAIGPGPRKRDAFSYTKTLNGGLTTIVVRNREMDILCSFYGPAAEANSELLAMGLEVAQNREVMQLAGFNLIGGAGDSIPVPILLKERWQYRMDVPFRIRQQQTYTYTVLSLISAQGTMTLQSGASEFIEENIVSQNPVPGYNQGGYNQGGYGQ
jgi:hypothetical protein